MRSRTLVLLWLTLSVFGVIYGLVFLLAPFVVPWMTPCIVRFLGVLLLGLSVWFYNRSIYEEYD